MNKHVQACVLLVLAQAACLGLGLWLEVRFTDSMAEDETGKRLAAPATVADGEKTEPTPSDKPESGAPDWLTKSSTAMRAMVFFWIAALQAVVAFLILMRLRAETSEGQLQAARDSLRQHNDLLRTRDAVIFGLAKLAESRDPETGNHLERIALYSTRLAAELRRHDRFRARVSPMFVKLIGVSSALHDIGKVGIEDSILLKPGKLEVEERFAMQMHAAIGGKCVREIELRLGGSNFLQMAREIATTHHEHWNGNGYPAGLAGEDIPLSGRIVAIVDVYDALSTKRVYKEAYPHEKCVQMIKELAGSQFDPELVEVFLAIQSEFRSIARRCADDELPEGPQAPLPEKRENSSAEAGPIITHAPVRPIGVNEAPVESPLVAC